MSTLRWRRIKFNWIENVWECSETILTNFVCYQTAGVLRMSKTKGIRGRSRSSASCSRFNFHIAFVEKYLYLVFGEHLSLVLGICSPPVRRYKYLYLYLVFGTWCRPVMRHRLGFQWSASSHPLWFQVGLWTYHHQHHHHNQHQHHHQNQHQHHYHNQHDYNHHHTHDN